MLLLDMSLPTPEENVALDEVLLLGAQSSSETSSGVLRFWESGKYFVVLGLSSVAKEDVYCDVCKSENIPIIRRPSGGGTVLEGCGCLNYSLILPYDMYSGTSDILNSYKIILGKICLALKSECSEFDVNPCGVSDIAIGKMKFSGNAQTRKKKFFLHHGTFLYNFDLKLIGKYLKNPPNQPVYRDNRSHSDFVTNIPLSKDNIKKAIGKEFGVASRRNYLSNLEKELMLRLVNEKYTKDEWNFRR